MARDLKKEAITAANIKTFREQAELKVPTVAAIIGLSPGMMTKIEANERGITRWKLERLAKFYRRPVGDFDEENPGPQKPVPVPPFALMALRADVDDELLESAQECIDKANDSFFASHHRRRSKNAG